MNNTGKFIISLDFELYWGLRDKKTIASYGRNLKNVHLVVPKLLAMFEKYNIHATWAYVGLLGLKDASDFHQFFPNILPSYNDTNLSPYIYMKNLGDQSVLMDVYHNGKDLLEAIKNTKHQELATHTFSHYYCLEPQENTEAFSSDLTMAIKQAKAHDIVPKGTVFPRNQYSYKYLKICAEFGIKTFRGNPNHWAYDPHNEKGNSQVKRLFRLADSYFNISGHKIAHIQSEHGVINVPASTLLRPYSKKLSMLEGFKVNRIKKAMTCAAKNGEAYHLWWHPHNFGSNMEKTFLN